MLAAANVNSATTELCSYKTHLVAATTSERRVHRVIACPLGLMPQRKRNSSYPIHCRLPREHGRFCPAWIASLPVANCTRILRWLGHATARRSYMTAPQNINYSLAADIIESNRSNGNLRIPTLYYTFPPSLPYGIPPQSLSSPPPATHLPSPFTPNTGTGAYN